MPESEITCPIAANSDVDARYVAGNLGADEAEAFERHYFECEQCWAAVERGVEVRAALNTGSELHAGPSLLRPPDALKLEAIGGRRIGSPPAARRGSRTLTALFPALAAAAVLFVAVAVWQLRESGAPARIAPNADSMRGTSDKVLAVSAHVTNTALTAAWSRLRDAESYRIRLLGADGTLFFQREISDTSIAIPIDSLSVADGHRAMYLEVQALNPLRRVVARSTPVPVGSSPGAR